MNIWEKYNIQVNDWDSLLIKKFTENTKSGVFCDVGACNGLFTNLFKEISTDGFVYSFEMNPNNYDNIKHLADDRCIIENMAVSSNVGEAEIYADNSNSSNFSSNIIGHDTSFRTMDSIGKIKTTTLDEYFLNKNLDYLKIDVEGSEFDVMKGGLETIKKCKYIVIECHIQDQWLEIFEFIKLNKLDFRNITNDKPVFLGETDLQPGLMSNGMPYQIYLKK